MKKRNNSLLKILDFFASENTPFFMLLLTAFLALSAAYTAQYAFGHKPCILCYYQRYAYYSLISLCFLALLANRYRKFFLSLCLIVGFASIGIATYHALVESGYIIRDEGCSPKIELKARTLAELKATLQNQIVASCEAASWQIFHISSTVWNSAFSIIWSSFIVFCLVKRVKNVKKT